MYECEFNQIWEAQIAYYPESLTPALQKQIGLLLFFQRPIAAQGHLIGKCELEPNERRASWATLEAQRFRILQKVNDLQIIYPGNPISQPLTSPEREFVFNLLDSEGDQTFANIRKHLQLDKKSVFNLERGDEKRLRGNRTNVVMRQAFAERWGAFSEEERKQIVEEWRTSESDEWLAKRGVDHWGLGPEIAATWSTKHPENGYCALSRKAIARLMPLMSEGVSFKTAETQLYGDRFSGATALDQLPVVKQYLTTLRNPAVERALTEMRKVVNAIVREYGKPYEIRIELARELKKPRQERVSATKANRKRQKEREDIMQRILQECGIPKERQSRKDIEKALLHVECGGMCPYTGRSIRFSDLFHDSQFDVEHIIPRSRYPDDSFQNKTLCYLPDNRERKRNKTPFEAYGSNEQEWAEILERVRKFGNAGKLKRFMLETLKDIEDFSARQMNDTRYASVLAGRLLGTLYGGRDVQGDVGMRQAVFVSSGAVTATLRRSWGLEAILHDLVPDTSGQGKGKPRTDHRHHAIDAIVIALTRQGMIQQMARAASTEPWQDGERTWRKIESPWRDFVDSIRPHIAELVVSHRPEHKMSGELHKGTNYSVPHLHKGKLTVHTRCALSALCAADIAAEDVIVDVAVRDAIRKKLDELGGSPKLFEKVENTPYLAARDGRQIPIRKVRIRETKNALQIGHGATARLVASGGIHHVAMFVTRDKKRCEVWKSNVVQITDIYQKLPRHDRRKGRPKSPSQGPVVFRGFPDDPDAQFVFSLMKDDTVALDVNGQARIFRVKKFSDNGQIWFVPANDAHDNATQMKSGITWSKKPNTLKELHPRKVVVDLLGKVHTAND
jgi:CRISPR-associated endonuclease Csn1